MAAWDAYLPSWLTEDTGPVTYVHTTPLTKYERAMVLGHRALQIAQNCQPRVHAPPGTDPMDVARMELHAGALPAMSVLRYLPDGTAVRKSVTDMFVRSKT